MSPVDRCEGCWTPAEHRERDLEDTPRGADVAAAVPLPLLRAPGRTAAPIVIDAVQKAAPQRIDGPIPRMSAGVPNSVPRNSRRCWSVAWPFTRSESGCHRPSRWRCLILLRGSGFGDSVPYGLPFVKSRADGAAVSKGGGNRHRYMAHASHLPEEVAKLVEASRRPFAAHVVDMVDLVGSHELGHLYVREWEIKSDTRWFASCWRRTSV